MLIIENTKILKLQIEAKIFFSAQQCCFHEGSGAKTAKILSFNDESLQYCKRVLQLRQDSKLKYSNVQIPENVDDHNGYHLQCYKRFTALSKLQREKLNEVVPTPSTPVNKAEKNTRLLRSELESPSSCNSTGVFTKVCLFCDRVEFQLNYKKHTLISCTTNEIGLNVSRFAKMLNDEPMLVKIKDVCFVAKEIHYHALCRTRYQMKAEQMSSQDKRSLGHCDGSINDWHLSRQIHKQSFEIVCHFIDEFILQKKEVYMIKELNKLYMAALGDLGGIEFKDVDISSDKLAKKINDKYGEQVTIEKGQTKKGNLIYSSQLDHSEFIRAEVSDETKTRAKIRNVAYKLREIIMETEKHPLPERLTVDDIIKGETDVPDTLFQFFNNLVSDQINEEVQQSPKNGG